MSYTTNNNLPLLPAGAVDWLAAYNDAMAKIEAGRTLYLEAGENLAARDCFYIKSDGKAWKCTTATPCRGIWKSTSTTAGAWGFGQIDGTMTYASWTWTKGATLYSTSSGQLSETPSAYFAGYAKSATEIVIKPFDGQNLSGTIKESIFLPVGYGIDGAAAPAAKSTLSSTNKVDIRNFDGASNEDLFFMWQVPHDLSGATIKFRVICFVSSSTPPAENEVIAFSLAGASIGNSELLSKTLGTAVTSSITCAAGYAQYDRVATDWSNDVTITDLAAGESVALNLIRLASSTDTYAQDTGVFGIEIKYSRDVSNT